MGHYRLRIFRGKIAFWTLVAKPRPRALSLWRSNPAPPPAGSRPSWMSPRQGLGPRKTIGLPTIRRMPLDRDLRARDGRRTLWRTGYPAPRACGEGSRLADGRWESLARGSTAHRHPPKSCDSDPSSQKNKKTLSPKERFAKHHHVRPRPPRTSAGNIVSPGGANNALAFQVANRGWGGGTDEEELGVG